MQIKKITLIVLAVLLVFATMIPFVSAAEDDETALGLAVETNVSPVVPGLVNVGEGDEVEAVISITENTGIYGLYFKIDYDPTVFDIIGKNTDGTVEVFNSKVSAPYEGGHIAKMNNAGTVSVNVNFGKVASAYTGELFTVYFKVLKNAHASLNITLADVSAFDSYGLNAGLVDAEAIEIVPAEFEGHGDALTETRIVESTCLEGGYTVIECSECDFEYRYEETEPSDHDFNVQTVAATCTEGGYSTRTCKVCGLTEKFDEVAALGHKEVTIPAVEPTATAEGKTEGKRCERCGLILVEQKTVPATGSEGGFNLLAQWWFWLLIILLIIAIVVIVVFVARKAKAGKSA